MARTKFRVGTRIEIRGFDLQNREVWYPAKIGRLHPSWKGEDTRGYHPVTYPDGGKLMCHESEFRVVEAHGKRAVA